MLYKYLMKYCVSTIMILFQMEWKLFCILLRHLAYPVRYVDMIPRFGSPIPKLCIIFNQLLDFIDTRWSHLLENLNQP